MPTRAQARACRRTEGSLSLGLRRRPRRRRPPRSPRRSAARRSARPRRKPSAVALPGQVTSKRGDHRSGTGSSPQEEESRQVGVLRRSLDSIDRRTKTQVFTRGVPTGSPQTRCVKHHHSYKPNHPCSATELHFVSINLCYSLF